MGGNRDAMTRQACGHATHRVAMAALGPGAAGGIDVRPDGGKIGHITGGHSLQRGLTAKEFVRAIDPAIGLIRARIDDLQGFPNAGDVANPAQRVL